MFGFESLILFDYWEFVSRLSLYQATKPKGTKKILLI
jgi:hypothetical protein